MTAPSNCDSRTTSPNQSRAGCQRSSPISLGEVFHLLYSDIERDSEFLVELVAAATQQRLLSCKSIAGAVVPVYVTSLCCEDCEYCNFRRSNRGLFLDRRRLTVMELEREIECLVHERGYHALELVYASDPSITAQDIANHVALCRRMLDTVGGGIIGINVSPMSTDGYKGLVSAGLDFAVQWQETYNRDRYSVYHANEGRKIDYDYRRNAYDRMFQAGIRHIGMGVLFGLAPWREDFQNLLEHEADLFERFGVWPAILGTARLKPAAGAKVKHTKFLPTNDELVFAIAVHALFSPRSVPWVSTREPWELCLRLAQGGCLFTFDCSTTPGGYSQQIHSHQFPTYDFPARVYAEKMKKHGLVPCFNWQFRQGLQRATFLREATGLI